MTIDLRPGVVDDAPAIARINVEAWLAAYQGIVSDSFLAAISVSAREHAWRERILGDPERPVLVAERDGELIGYCGMSAPSRDADAAIGVAEITAIYVSPRVWRSGAGRALMDAALSLLRAHGWQSATLWVFQANAQARAFYEAFGFTVDGTTQTHAQLGTGALEVRMRLTL
jgi:L-amino acid N-acyltransferase YncA